MQKSKEETKICADADCLAVGISQPLRNFYKTKSFKSGLNPEGFDSKCKSCRLRIQKKAYYRRKKKNKKPGAASEPVYEPIQGPGKIERPSPWPPPTADSLLPAVSGPSPAEKTDLLLPNDKDFVILDFSNHSDLYKTLIEAAASNFRTPELQMLYYCNEALNGRSTK